MTFFETQTIASLLDDFYPVRRIRTGRIELVTPASTLNAVDWLHNHGIDADSRSTGGWEVQV
jgi:hypothetical protein